MNPYVTETWKQMRRYRLLRVGISLLAVALCVSCPLACYAAWMIARGD